MAHENNAQEAWRGRAGAFLTPVPRLQVQPILPGRDCVVIDDALQDPQAVVDWAAAQSFEPPRHYPYPGLVLEAPPALRNLFADFFAEHVRGRLGARRVRDVLVRFSLVTTPPAQLAPVQWQCHRDRLPAGAGDAVLAAAVLYLCHDPALGGTSFYQPRLPADVIDRMVADSAAMGPAEFGARYGLEPGYMAGDNAHFRRVASVPARWNRLLMYDGSTFHSADVGTPGPGAADPRRGRLTLNAFLTCSRSQA